MITHIDFDWPVDNLGFIARWSDTTGRSGATTVDELGREVTLTETAFDGEHQRRMTRVYDPVSGKPQFLTRPFNAASVNASWDIGWTFTYDEMGRMTSVAPPGEALRTMVYDRLKMTRQVSQLDKSYLVADGLGRVVLTAAIELSSPSPNHEIKTSFVYGPFWTPRHVRLPGGGTVTASYDHVGHRTQLIDPDAGIRTTIFNAFGEVEREQVTG